MNMIDALMLGACVYGVIGMVLLITVTGYLLERGTITFNSQEQV